MTQTTGRILKSNAVKTADSYQLETAPATAPLPRTNIPQPAQQSLTPQANVIHNGPDFAIIEVICSCGVKTQVKCQYNNKSVQTTNPPQ